MIRPRNAGIPIRRPGDSMEAGRPVRDEHDDQELDADCCRKEGREQPKHDAERAHGRARTALCNCRVSNFEKARRCDWSAILARVALPARAAT